jgi:hypothetical protein
MESLAFSDPIMEKWVQSLLENSKTIRKGRYQQKIERPERERLVQEQNLVSNEPDGPYNYTEDETDNDNQLEESDLRCPIGTICSLVWCREAFGLKHDPQLPVNACMFGCACKREIVR